MHSMIADIIGAVAVLGIFVGLPVLGFYWNSVRSARYGDRRNKRVLRSLAPYGARQIVEAFPIDERCEEIIQGALG